MRTQYKVEAVDGVLGPKTVSREFYSSQDFMDVYNIGLNKAIKKSVAFHNSQYGKDIGCSNLLLESAESGREWESGSPNW